jgi:hypothetical protein
MTMNEYAGDRMMALADYVYDTSLIMAGCRNGRDILELAEN